MSHTSFWGRYQNFSGQLFFGRAYFKIFITGTDSINSFLQLVDPDTREEIQEPNRPGELLIYGGCAIYLNNPEATKKAYEDGWYKTGDLFYFNEDGYYFAVARLKEMFKYKSFQVRSYH